VRTMGSPKLVFPMVVVLMFGIVACAQSFGRFSSDTQQPAGQSQSGYNPVQPGPYSVSTLEFPDLVDKSRNNRSVPLKIHFPNTGENLPIVVISHGAGATWDANIYQAQHLASHGYLAICPRHVDSDFERKNHLMSRAGGNMRQMEAVHYMTTDSRAVLERPKDISFAINQAIQWNQSLNQLKGRLNTSKVAVMGHSFGAYTTLVCCGARPALDYLKPKVGSGKGVYGGDLSDSRITFGLALSPQGPGSTFFGKDSYRTINRPLIMMTGSKDGEQSATGGRLAPESRKEAFQLSPSGQKYFIWLANADHLSFSESPQTKKRLRGAAVRNEVQRVTKATMVISCDYFLKGKKDTIQMLNQQYLNSLTAKAVPTVTVATK